MLLFNTCLIIGRITFTQSLTMTFILWNMLLAVLPLFFSYRLIGAEKVQKMLYLGAWLAFFPNAMYIVTDLFHLKLRNDIPQWYDLLILISAALNGLILGFVSLQNVEQYLRTRIPSKYIHRIVLPIFILCGYGIYLGRYMRWNSWDIITNTYPLIRSIKSNLVHPIQNIECWLLSLLFGVWLYLVYRYFKKITRVTNRSQIQSRIVK